MAITLNVGVVSVIALLIVATASAGVWPLLLSLPVVRTKIVSPGT
jgi:hypothetical protein